MSKIVICLADGFEEMEALTPADILRRLGCEVVLAGVTGMIVKGSHGITVNAEIPFDKFPDDADAIYLPGGLPGAYHLRDSAAVIAKVQKFAENGKLVVAICAAPIALAKAGIAQGKKVTGYPGTEKDVCGLEYTGNRVERDGNILTGKGPGAAIELSFALAAAAGCGKQQLDALKAGMFIA